MRSATYFVYAFLLPTLALILAGRRTGSVTSSPGSTSTSPRMPSSTVLVSRQQWTQLAVTGVIWLVVPLAVGLRVVVRAEVK